MKLILYIGLLLFNILLLSGRINDYVQRPNSYSVIGIVAVIIAIICFTILLVVSIWER